MLSFQASHFKSDWHRFNLHRAVNGSDAVTEEEFLYMVEGSCVHDVFIVSRM